MVIAFLSQWKVIRRSIRSSLLGTLADIGAKPAVQRTAWKAESIHPCGCLQVAHTVSTHVTFRIYPSFEKLAYPSRSNLLQRCSVACNPSHSLFLQWLPSEGESELAGFNLCKEIALEKPTAWLGRPLHGTRWF